MYPQDSGTPVAPEAAPAPAAEETSNVEAAPQLDGEQSELVQDAPQLTDEDYRLNFLGTDKFEIPKGAPEEVRTALKNLEKSLNKGWTEKNMRLAEERKAVAAQQQETVQEAEVQKATIKELAKLEYLQDQLTQYDNVDWQQWATTDPESANRAFMAYQGLQRQHAKLDTEVKTKQDQQRQQQQQRAQAWLQQAEAKLSENIKDWSRDKGAKIQKFVSETYLNTNTPMDSGALQAVSWHPGLVQMANEAMLYRESLKRAAASPSQTPAAPVPKVGGAAPAAKDPNKMTDAEWFQWREKQLADQRRAAPMNRRR
jgi:DNA-binding phage protein